MFFLVAWNIFLLAHVCTGPPPPPVPAKPPITCNDLLDISSHLYRRVYSTVGWSDFEKGTKRGNTVLSQSFEYFSFWHMFAESPVPAKPQFHVMTWWIFLFSHLSWRVYSTGSCPTVKVGK